jgi:predicted nucleic acid-binding protein
MAALSYFDTSVLLKCYLREPASPRARALARRHRILSSAVAPAEAISALCRRRATGGLGNRDVAAIMVRLTVDRARWELIGLTSLVLGRAETLIRQHALRTLDAIHFASALVFHEETGARPRFVTAAALQRRVAAQLGLEVVWVG